MAMYKLRICSHSSVYPGPLVPGISRYDSFSEGGFYTWEMDSSAGYLVDDFSAYDVDFSPDNYVQDATNTQAYNRYSYALNNPLKYTDPDGESIIAAVIIGAAIGAYLGGTMADNDLNPFDWDYSSGRTWGYIAGGAIVGAASGYVGGYIAGLNIPAANTLGIVGSSFVNSVGTMMYTGGRTDFSVGFGIASYNFDDNEFGYLGKKGNSALENIGYSLGALANIQDGVAAFNGVDLTINAHRAKGSKDITGHSAAYNKTNVINISVAGTQDNVTSKSGLGRDLYYLKNNFIPKKGRHCIGYSTKGWKNYLQNVNGEILERMTNRLSIGRGSFGLMKLEYGFLFGCQSHVGRSLWGVGIPTLPINFHPYILNTQLMIREIGIYASPFLIN